MNNHRYCVIMADGTGSPYQLRLTYDRFIDLVPADNIIVVTLYKFAESARRILPELPTEIFL